MIYRITNVAFEVMSVILGIDQEQYQLIYTMLLILKWPESRQDTVNHFFLCSLFKLVQ